jgi:hypothetical protein
VVLVKLEEMCVSFDLGHSPSSSEEFLLGPYSPPSGHLSGPSPINSYNSPLDLKVPFRTLSVTPGFNAKLNAHSMCAQESSFHTYRTENKYRIINVSI